MCRGCLKENKKEESNPLLAKTYYSAACLEMIATQDIQNAHEILDQALDIGNPSMKVKVLELKLCNTNRWVS